MPFTPTLAVQIWKILDWLQSGKVLETLFIVGVWIVVLFITLFVGMMIGYFIFMPLQNLLIFITRKPEVYWEEKNFTGKGMLVLGLVFLFYVTKYILVPFELMPSAP